MEQVILLFAKRFAEEGFYVFPFYDSSKGPMKPFGWARNKPGTEVSEAKVIPATNDPSFIDEWPARVKAGYNSTIAGYGILGVGCVIFDLDNKKGKCGSDEFKKFKVANNLPEPSLVIKSRSGGYHLYYAKPSKLANMELKSVVDLSLAGVKYPGIDIRGDGGMVVGPLSEGKEEDWEDGQYMIIKGGPEVELTEIPLNVTIGLSRSSMSPEMHDSMTVPEVPMDEMEILKRGEIPQRLSNGNRNNGFYIYLNALKNKGFTAETARRYVQSLIAVTEDPDTLHESVNIEDMISRIWKTDLGNPYDVCRDIIDCGLYRLTSYKGRLMYIILNENPYIDSRSAHDIQSVKQLTARYTRKVNVGDGKSKNVNPAELIDAQITADREVATIGFKPGASEVFTLTEAEGGKRYLNVWNDPRTRIIQRNHNEVIWDKYRFLVSRIFGPEGSEEFQLGMDFVAWIIQKPGVKPVVSPFIMSRIRGVGKSLFFSMISQMFGYSKQGDLQAKPYKIDEIGGRFFSPNGSSIILFDEVQFPVHRNMRMESAHFWRHLKNLVTADTVPVEFKGGETVQMPNLAGIMMAGNTGSNFPVEEFDRRIWLIDNEPPPLEEGTVDEFFMMTKNEMGREEKREIINCLLSHLADHKIKLPLDRIRAPMTDIKKEMYLSTLSDIEEWWITHFDDRENLLAASPVLSKSAIIYLISVSERLMNSRWREDPESTFRELKRRGLIQPIRTKGDNYQSRNIRNVPIVRADGSTFNDGDGRDVLYTSRQHGEMNGESNEAILNMYYANINSIQRLKSEAFKKRGNQITNQLN